MVIGFVSWTNSECGMTAVQIRVYKLTVGICVCVIIPNTQRQGCVCVCVFIEGARWVWLARGMIMPICGRCQVCNHPLLHSLVYSYEMTSPHLYSLRLSLSLFIADALAQNAHTIKLHQHPPAGRKSNSQQSLSL